MNVLKSGTNAPKSGISVLKSGVGVFKPGTGGCKLVIAGFGFREETARTGGRGGLLGGRPRGPRGLRLFQKLDKGVCGLLKKVLSGGLGRIS
jgi:hypothetical protein